MSGRVDELRWALHDNDWVVVTETESTDCEPGTWLIEHQHHPVRLQLVFECMGADGYYQPIQWAYGASAAGNSWLGVSLSGKKRSRTRNIQQFIEQLTVYAHTAQQAETKRQEHIVDLGHLRTTQALFSTLAADLSFPEYFGHNWSALDDCMRDLSWLAGPLMIRFTGLDRLAKRNPYLYSQVCDCVAFWQQYWENTSTRWELIES